MKINFIDGFRPIRRSDIQIPFRTSHPIMDNFTLRDYFVWGSEADSMSLVKEMTEEDDTTAIAAVIYLTLHPDYVKVEMLGRRRLTEQDDVYKGSGFDLLLFVELNIARANGFHEVRLQAIEGMVEQYRKKGYSAIPGAAFSDEKWGVLTPMAKRL